MKFSQRKGHTTVASQIQVGWIHDDLRASLWNVVYMSKWPIGVRGDCDASRAINNIRSFGLEFWVDYYKRPVDEMPNHVDDLLNEIRVRYFHCPWYEVYDILELLLNHFADETLNSDVNTILERELSGYRFVGSVFTDITSKEEVMLLQDALADNDVPAVSAHLRRALELMSDRKSPDYRNSIKESISAVEGIARVIAGAPRATLADALKGIERNKRLHPALKESFLKLYGYTSDENGIRHAMLDEPSIDVADAKFFLLSCTSFVNYLKSRM